MYEDLEAQLEAHVHLSGFTFRINAQAAILGQTLHQLTPIFHIAAQGGFSEKLWYLEELCLVHSLLNCIHPQ